MGNSNEGSELKIMASSEISLPNTTSALNKKQKTKFLSLVSIFVVMFVNTFTFAIFLPTMPLYLEQLGQGATFFGFCISAFNLASLLFSVPIGYLSSRYRISIFLYLCSILNFIAFLLYSLVANPWSILASRIVAGIATNQAAIANAYIAFATAPKERTGIMQKLVFVTLIAFLCGVLSSFGISYLGKYQVSFFTISPYTSVGFISAILALLNILQLAVLFRDPSAAEKIHGQGPANEKPVKPQIGGCVGWIVQFFVINCVWCTFEVVNSLFVKDVFGWKPQYISLTWFLTSLVSLIAVFIFGFFATKVKDTVLLYVSMFTLGVAQALMIMYRNVKMTPYQYILAILLLAVSFSFNRISILGGYSKILGQGFKGTYMGIFIGVGRIGTILMSPVAGYVFSQVSMNDTWILSIVLIIVSLTVALCLHREMFTYNKGAEQAQAQQNVPSLTPPQSSVPTISLPPPDSSTSPLLPQPPSPPPMSERDSIPQTNTERVLHTIANNIGFASDTETIGPAANQNWTIF